MFKLSKADRDSIEKTRGTYDPASRWYVLLTFLGREYKIRHRIEKDFAGPWLDEILLPEVRKEHGRADQHELLFGGHLFLRCPMNDDLYMTVTAYPDVYQILGRAYRIPTPVPDTEIEVFKDVLSSYPRPLLAKRLGVGRCVRVARGLMAGLTGRIFSSTAHHVKLETNFSFLGQENSVVVTVPWEQIELDESDATSVEIA